jgi:transposase-like protein
MKAEVTERRPKPWFRQPPALKAEAVARVSRGEVAAHVARDLGLPLYQLCNWLHKAGYERVTTWRLQS